MQFPFSKPRTKTPPPAAADPHPLAALHHHFTALQSHISASANHALPALNAAAAVAAAAANHALPALQSHISASANHALPALNAAAAVAVAAANNALPALQSHISASANHALPALNAAAAAAVAAANHALPVLQSRISAAASHALPNLRAAASRTSLPLARLSPLAPAGQSERMSTDSIAERLAGVPVYALANADEEFVLVSGAGMSRKKGSLGLLCFKREDAEALLDQVKEVDSGMREGSKVVELALNKVFHLKVDGVAFRFIPDPSQVANAIKEKERAGDSTEDFSGVPVFQSKSLVLRSLDKKYHPVFFRKEDLEESLRRAARVQRKLNPILRGDIQVGVLEEIIEAMKGSSVSEWGDVVFIPPGVDVPAGVTEERLTGNA